MQTKMKVEGMACSHCESAVKNALSAIAGVAEAAVDLAAKTVTVAHEENVSVETLKRSIEGQGFEVTG